MRFDDEVKKQYPTRFYLKKSYNAGAISADYQLETPTALLQINAGGRSFNF